MPLQTELKQNKPFPMKPIRTLLLLSLAATSLFAQTPAPAAGEAWTIDKNHSSATFKVRHITANVVGQFREFEGAINLDRSTITSLLRSPTRNAPNLSVQSDLALALRTAARAPCPAWKGQCNATRRFRTNK